MPTLLGLIDKNYEFTILRLETGQADNRWQSLVPSALRHRNGYYRNSGNDIVCYVNLGGGHQEEVLTLWDVRDLGDTLRLRDWAGGVLRDDRLPSNDPAVRQRPRPPMGFCWGSNGITGLQGRGAIDQARGGGYITNAGACVLEASTFRWELIPDVS